jgi:hypothetical protein
MRLVDVRDFIMGIIIASFCCCSFGTTTAVAQERGGAITGVISDPTGAVIPKAQITATGSDGVTMTTVSDTQGRYILQDLLPGEYRVEIITEGCRFQACPYPVSVTGNQRSPLNPGSSLRARL